MNIFLRQARLKARLTQEELAELLGTSAVSIWRWESGALPSLYYQQQLCHYFATSAGELGWPAWKREQHRTPGPLVDPLVFPPSHPLLGRQAALTFVHTHLRPPGERSCVGVVGLPGSGKTAVVRQLVATASMQQEFAGVLWASVGQGIPCAHHLQRWAALLGLARTLPADLTELQDLLRTAIGRRRFLVVLDNVGAVEEALPLLRIGSPTCCFLLTTRQPGVANLLCRQVLSLSGLAVDDAFTLLTTDLPTALLTEHRSRLSQLVQRSGRLPLEMVLMGEALRQAAHLPSPQAFREALAHLMQRAPSLAGAGLLHMHVPWQGSSLSQALQDCERYLSPPMRTAFRLLAIHFLDAPFREQDVATVLRFSGPGQEVLHGLRDAGLLEWSSEGHYHFHPLVVEYGLAVADTPTHQGWAFPWPQPPLDSAEHRSFH